MEQTPLHERACVPCKGGMPPMNRGQAETMAARVEGWMLADDALSIGHDFKFKDFKEAMAFVNAVAELAEMEGHHPDIHVTGWNKVRLDLSTHAIKGLSDNDFILAAKINRL